ncbi:MAG: glucosyl-3-phosphoglycerate synthase [Chloroflexia bacterium]
MSHTRKACSYRILLPMRATDCDPDLLRLGLTLLPEAGGEVVLQGIVILPEGEPISSGAVPAQICRQAMGELAGHADAEKLSILPRIAVGYEAWSEVQAACLDVDAQLLVLPWDGPDLPLLGVPVERVLSEAPCDLVLVHGIRLDACRKILLPMRGGLNADLALQAAGALARASGGEITLLHVSGPRELPAELRGLRKREPRITRAVEASRDPLSTLLEEARNHDAIILGATLQDQISRTVGLGPILRQVLERSGLPAILVRSRHLGPLPLPGQLAQVVPSAPPDISSLVDRWFASNTFHSSEFSDLEQLLRLKRARGVTISLALPALNEAATIRNVITTLRHALMEEVPLLDEIVLIDSNSTDGTREIATSLGIPVYIHQHILAEEVGSFPGKGEALWKSLYVTRGDLIVWVDTDIVNIHPRFVYGLLGPLLLWDSIQYVKGFYRRPIRVDGQLRAHGGGRVTELLARPLINLFFPELSGLIQPLAGEYAGRRQALEQVPFFSGYGVEIGLLIDILDRFGLEAIAQVDLEERIHRNQPLVNLSRMAFAILQVFISRLEARSKVRLLEEMQRSMKLIRSEPGRFFLEVERISDVERPPMITVPAYRRARGIE